MANLKGSIESVFSVLGNIVKENRLVGGIKSTYSLLGSVETFARSFSIRVFLKPMAVIYTSVFVNRFMKTFLNSKSNIYTRLKAYKNMKNVHITSKSSVVVRIGALKRIKININANPIFGKESDIEILDSFSLDQMDEVTLGDLEFTEGIYANVIKSISVSILGMADINTNIYIVRYNKLQQFDDMTIGSIDEMTLDELDITEV